MVYLSDFIEEEYKQWQPKDIIFLCGQTGAGKTTFVMDKLLKYIPGENSPIQILYICNRRALYEQILASSEESIRDVFLLYTYQEIEENQRNFWEAIHSDSSKIYLIFDEVHYITQDALFNSGTHYWYDIITRALKFERNCIPIFITATPDEVLPFLYSHMEGVSMLKRDANSSEIHRFTDISRVNENIFRHNIQNIRDHLDDWKSKQYGITFYPPLIDNEFPPPDYSYVIPYLYYDDSELVEKILEGFFSRNHEKWLIFVERIKQGADMEEKLCSLCPGIKVVSLNSKSGDGQKLTDQIFTQDQQEISCDVLITTSVLINGVSLKDPNIKNIVLPYTQKVDLLQALDRVRIAPDKRTKCNVFFRLHDYRDIYTKLMVIKRDLLRLIQSVNVHNSILTPCNSNNSEQCGYIADSRFAYSHNWSIQTRLRQSDVKYFHNIKNFLFLPLPTDREPVSTDGDVSLKYTYEINRAALFHALYSYIQYEDVLLRYREKYLSDSDAGSDAEPRETTDNRISPTEKRRFFFIEQLRWLGLSEDPEIIKRIGDGSISLSFKRKADELMQLKNKYENRPIEKIEQEEFRREMYEVLKYLSPDVFYDDNFRYKKANEGSEGSFALPGKKRINKALMPYRLEVVSDYRKRKTTWLLRDIADSEVERAE